MGGRSGGVLLLVAALAALIVVAGLQRPDTTGRAVPQYVPAPPSVGDCLLSTPPATPDVGVSNPLLPAATFGPCAGTHFGEVAEVLSHRPAVVNEIVCGDERRYVGLPASAEATNWLSPINPFVVWANPTPLQQAAGQRWVACIVTPGGTEPYRGTVGHALTGGRLPSIFSTCVTGTDVHADWISCSSPHRSELLGQASPTLIAGGQAYLDAMCATYAQRLTRRSGIGVGGQLRATALSEHTAGSPGTPTAGLDPVDPSSGNSSSTCILSVTGSHPLTGSLIGIGDAPLPLG